MTERRDEAREFVKRKLRLEDAPHRSRKFRFKHLVLQEPAVLAYAEGSDDPLPRHDRFKERLPFLDDGLDAEWFAVAELGPHGGLHRGRQVGQQVVGCGRGSFFPKCGFSRMGPWLRLAGTCAAG